MTPLANELSRLLAASKFEIIPLKNVGPKTQYLPDGAMVSVTASPAKGQEATLTLTEELQPRGLELIPHLAARMIEDRSHLEKLLTRMDKSGITRAFVVGGDATDPAEFTDAAQLLDAMAEIGSGINYIGIGGYPEGHPEISKPALRAALVAKAPQASYIATQMCFDVEAIVSWIREIRAAGIDLPVYVGMPGVADPVRLASISARIGVGASIRYVMKNRSFLLKLLRPAPYKPTKLVNDIARACVDEDLGIAGFHFFTFNEIQRTVDWWRGELARAGGRS